VTAEWNCTRCGSTNRKLVPADSTQIRDRCNHCRAWHIVEADDRPVRWNARLDD
jgi:DNA-directed RNA polymerase subunit RPC12/RpoP